MAGEAEGPVMASHDYWHTPPSLYALLDAEFCFQVDAAASAENTFCPLWCGLDSVPGGYAYDALTSDWSFGGEAQRVWCNPPYSKMGEFVFRAWEQCQAHRLTVVLLIPAYTDPCYWWDCIVPYADEIRFLRGRVSFLERGAQKTSARFPSVVIVFRYRAGELRGSPRVTWWDWKPAAKVPYDTPLLDAVDPVEGIVAGDPRASESL